MNRDVSRDRDRLKRRDENDNKQKKTDTRSNSRWSNNSPNLQPKKDNFKSPYQDKQKSENNAVPKKLEPQCEEISPLYEDNGPPGSEKDLKKTAVLNDSSFLNRLSKTNLNDGNTTPLHDERDVPTVNNPENKQKISNDKDEQKPSQTNKSFPIDDTLASRDNNVYISNENPKDVAHDDKQMRETSKQQHKPDEQIPVQNSNSSDTGKHDHINTSRPHDIESKPPSPQSLEKSNTTQSSSINSEN